MGSSTRNNYKRSNKIIAEGVENRKIGELGNGLGELFELLVFPSKGQSKIRATLNENLYSEECTNSIKNIIKLSKAVNAGTLSSIGFGSITEYSNIEIKEKICDFLGISNNEILKTSLKETLNTQNIFDKAVNIINFISDYVKNIISNIYKKFTYEDALNILEDFSSEEYSNSIDDYMKENIVPLIEYEFEEIEINDSTVEEDENFTKKIKDAFTSIMKKMRRAEDNG